MAEEDNGILAIGLSKLALLYLLAGCVSAEERVRMGISVSFSAAWPLGILFPSLCSPALSMKIIYSCYIIGSRCQDEGIY